MTFQVALVGTDGIVLAGDKKAVIVDKYQTTSLISKIKADFEKGIIIACAGSEISVEVANRILAQPNVLEEVSSPPGLVKIAQAAYKEGLDDKDGGQFRTDSAVIVVSMKNLQQIYCLKMAERFSNLNQYENKAIIGDTANSAVYLVERYYQRVSIELLVPLAATAVLAAGKMNPIEIEGIEVFTCTSKGIERLTDSRIESLSKRADEIDSTIRRLLFAS